MTRPAYGCGDAFPALARVSGPAAPVRIHGRPVALGHGPSPAGTRFHRGVDPHVAGG